jgi:glycosyltransferase involved in cell wall biosynthesis
MQRTQDEDRGRDTAGPSQDARMAPANRPPRLFARVSLVMPTLNAAASLPHVFARVSFEDIFEVLIVDGHSTDDTIRVARAAHPPVRVILQGGSGKDDALACGFAAARGEVIVTLDADGSADPAEIPSYLEPLFAGADCVKSSHAESPTTYSAFWSELLPMPMSAVSFTELDSVSARKQSRFAGTHEHERKSDRSTYSIRK